MFSFLKWLSVIRPRAVTGHLHLSDTGLWMWERARITCQPWRKKESVKCKQSYRYFIEQNSDSCSTYCTCISLALELRHGGRDQGVCGLGSIITALSAAGARAGHLSSPPSSHHQAWPRVQSETDLCVTRIPEIHSLNEWDTLIESRIGTRYISFLST